MTKHDRCDRYGAEAMHRYEKNGQELMFCNHHNDEYGPALNRQKFILVASKELESV